MFPDVGTANYFFGSHREVFEQYVLAGRKRYLLAAAPDSMRRSLDLKIFNSNSWVLRAIGAASQRPYARKKFLKCEGLDHIVIRTQVKPFYPVGDSVAGSEDKNVRAPPRRSHPL